MLQAGDHHHPWLVFVSAAFVEESSKIATVAGLIIEGWDPYMEEVYESQCYQLNKGPMSRQGMLRGSFFPAIDCLVYRLIVRCSEACVSMRLSMCFGMRMCLSMYECVRK